MNTRSKQGQTSFESDPLVSILMPFRNTEKYLKDCLDSILKQDYTNWELLAVNDHSSDKSESIVKQYAHRDNRIKLLQNDGKGIIPALRTAYAKSSGAYISRMDSDDIMVPEKIATLIAGLIQEGPGHLAVGQVKYFSERGISNGYARYEKWINDLTLSGDNFGEIYKECVIPSPCWMVLREDLDASGAFRPNRYPEDYDLTFRFYERGLKCLPCKEVLHFWRDYDTRTSRTSEHYAQNYFLDIKLHYFLKLDYCNKRPLVLWGAGNKGKTLAKGLKQRGIPFTWLCDNPKKIGKSIYDIPLAHYQNMAEMKRPQSIISVANELAQEDIRRYLSTLEFNKPGDNFFFC
ncbi:glycosyltransferase [Flavobacteriaceae bacterium D16]|nr:glycosyltransferase [Flavobacteriaceae bacterium D16]